MGCCQSAATAPAAAYSRSIAGREQAAPSATEAPVLTEVTAYERALSELKRIFEEATANGLGHASKAELINALEQAQELIVLLKEAGMEEMLGFVNRLIGHEGDFVSWDEFQEYAKKAVKHEVAVMEEAVMTGVEAGEEVLRQLKEFFESLIADEHGSVSKDALATGLQHMDVVKSGSMGSMIRQASFNPLWNIVDKLDTNNDGRVTWEEFQAHVRGAATDVGKKIEVARKAAMEELKHEVKVLEEVVVADVEAGEEVLRRLKEFFESLIPDEHGAVSKDELAIGLQDTDTVKSGSIGNLIRQASFNPLWNILDKLDTNNDGRITWEEFQAHVRGTATDIEKKIEVALSGQGCWKCC